MRWMNLTPEVAAYYGAPLRIEEWRFELFAALRNPDGYSAALATVDNAALHAAFARLIWIEQGASQCIQYFVPAELSEEFAFCITDLRKRVADEAVARGVTLVPERRTLLN